MKIERPNAKELTTAELESLEKLRRLLEQAIADGVMSPSEVAAFKAHTWADGKITPQELELYQTLVLSKIRRGELEWGFDDYSR